MLLDQCAPESSGQGVLKPPEIADACLACQLLDPDQGPRVPRVTHPCEPVGTLHVELGQGGAVMPQ